MGETAAHGVSKAVDSIQHQLCAYASGLTFEQLPADAIHAAKVRIIDIFGALIGGYFGEALQIARNLAAGYSNEHGATIIGTRMKTTPDMAAFVNASAPHYVEMQDAYHWPGGALVGHPSDTIMPILAAGEHRHVSGRQFMTAVVLGYEVFCRFSDKFHNAAFDYANFSLLGSAVGAGKVLGLTSEQLSHCISMAVVPNVALRQAKDNHLSMWKEMASGQAGRAGVFAALLARAGMEGPHLPFEGKAGWCDHVARERFTLGPMGGEGGERFRVQESLIKNRPAAGSTISTILAAEKVGPLRDIKDVRKITVEVYKRVENNSYSDERLWNPDSRGVANHSFPYCVAVALMDGRVTSNSFNEAHIWNPGLRDLMRKIEIVVNDEFAKAYERIPQEHRSRVTVETMGGNRLVGETGGDDDDLAAPRSDAQIEEKFRELAEDALGAKRVKSVLDQLWNLDAMADIGKLPPAFVFV